MYEKSYSNAGVAIEAPPKTQALFAILDETEAILVEAAKSSSHMSDKLVGPCPEEKANQTLQNNTLDARARRLRDLASTIVQEIRRHHAILGDI